MKYALALLLLLPCAFSNAAAPVVVDSDTDTQNSGGDEQLNFTLPGGAPNDGDLLLAYTLSGNFGSRDIATPTGWTSIIKSTQSNKNLQVFYRFASSDDANFTFDMADSATEAGGVVIRITGAANPIDYPTPTTDATNTDYTAIVSPAITPNAADSLVFRMVQSNRNSGTLTADGANPPSGYTNVATVAPSGAVVGKFVLDYTTHGATSTGTENYQDSNSSASVFGTLTFALSPSAGSSTNPNPITPSIPGGTPDPLKRGPIP